MTGVLTALGGGGRAVSYTLGALVVGLAGASAATSLGFADIAAWAERVFGATFLVLLVGLIVAAVYAWLRMRSGGDPVLWLEAGLQAAGGIATLALTYTLLGISLGVGSLAEHALTPETVPEVIRNLTAKFSLAFLTTVVGLPLSAVLRTLLLITHARLKAART